MRITASFILLFQLAIMQVAVSQQLVEKTQGTSEFSVTKSFSEIKANADYYEPYQAREFKKPNPVVYHPEFEINPKEVVFMENLQSAPVIKTNREVSPMPDTTFLGLYDSGNSIPPDVNGAPGPDHLMVTLNTEVRIQDRVGNALSTMSLGMFWNDLPGGSTFDPKILYDAHENRWIFVTCSSSEVGSSRLYLGVTESSDPTGVWHLYSFITDPQSITWFDYPSMGFNDKWIAVGGNMFGGDFYSTMWVFDKHAMYDGVASVPYTRFATNQGFTLVPAITFDQTEENMYIVSSANSNQGGNGYISLFKVTGPTASPSFSKVGDIGTPNPWAGSAGNNGDFLPQLGSSQKINSVDHRMENVIFRNGKIWAVHHVFLPASNPQRTAVQWWELSPAGEILQRGRIDDPSNLMSYAFPTIAVNDFEDITIGHGSFSSQQYASAAYSFRFHNDEPNTMRDPYTYKNGLASYYKTFGGGRNRWGDYTATMLDPINGKDFWVLQEYAELPSGGDRWATQWARIRTPFAPQSDFEANEVLIPLGENIRFTDLSEGVPQQWEWNFEGAEPAQSNEQFPSGITYNTEGTFGVSLTSSNDFGTNTLTKPAYITVSATLLPEVAFEADKPLICVGGAVKFTDKSNYMPREWEWSFVPATLTFVNGTDAFSQNPEVVFDEAATYSVSLKATNLNGSSTETYFDMITVGGLSLPYTEYFDGEDFNAGGWSVENPDDDVTWEIVTVGGLEGVSTAASVDFFHYFAIGQRDRLISPSFNLRNYENVNLSFRHAYAARRAQFADSLIVYISDNCGENWTRLFADAENGNGNFATHPLVEGFVPENVWDWCGVEWGADCKTFNLNEWIGKTDVKIAFETYSFYGNPIYITDVELGPTVGIETAGENSQLLVSPNPATELLVIEDAAAQKINKLMIVNTLGQVVYRLENTGLSRITINVKEMPAGIYLVEATVGAQQNLRKLVIN
ncbi:MAG: T9SS type A sorting domain-containing protein [Bacteroidetes bacterium]|nr:T9SS type A sorting domain-containing protein [Bacteroidota bacterium]